VREDDVRALGGLTDAPGLDIATVRVANASLPAGAPQAEQNRPLSATSPPQEAHFTMTLS
jgi:hypothetical protein